MPIEAGTTIGGLNLAWPLEDDPRSEGDDHLRKLKEVLKWTFDGMDDAQLAEFLALYLPLTGGTLTGALILSADPSSDLEAAPKQYVDANAGGVPVFWATITGSTGSIMRQTGEILCTRLGAGSYKIDIPDQVTNDYCVQCSVYARTGDEQRFCVVDQADVVNTNHFSVGVFDELGARVDPERLYLTIYPTAGAA